MFEEMRYPLNNSKYKELAEFNAYRNKSRFNDKYIAEMAVLQKEYNQDIKDWASANGHTVI